MRIRAGFLVMPVLVLAIAGAGWGQVARIQISESEPGIEVLRQTDDALTFRITVGELAALDVATKEGTFSRLMLPAFHHSWEVGRPELPMINRLFEIPYGAEVSVEVVSCETREVRLADHGIRHPLMPAQPGVSKSDDPAALPFHYDRSAYALDREFGFETARAVDTGQLRGVRLGRLEVAPVRYNPVAGTITVRENIEVAVRFAGADYEQDDYFKACTYSPFFEPVYNMLAGYRGIHNSHPDLMNGPVTYVIVSDPDFAAQLQFFRQWKEQQGFKVHMAYTNNPAVGNTAASIKAYLHNLYNSGTPQNPAPTFVLFAGDINKVPTFTLGGATDLPYCAVTADKIPEMYYGRFSARNTGEMQPIIDKTLIYEMYLMPNPAYLGHAVMVAGVDANYAATYGNGAINYGTKHYFNAAHGILSHTYLYPASDASGAASEIRTHVSNGCCYVNYTAHGSETSWSDPSFTRSHVNGLANIHEYCQAVGNCCLTASFQVGDCFAERWLRAEGKGAIGYIGGSNVTYWYEDYCWAVGVGPVTGSGPSYNHTRLGAYDGIFHDHGEGIGQWYVVQDAQVFCGNLAVTESGSSRVSYYWEIYNLMGDPSLSVYFGVPTANNVVLPDHILEGATHVTVRAEPNSYVGFTKGVMYKGGGLIGSSGTGNIPISGQGNSGTVKIVVTCQNKIPYVANRSVLGPVCSVNPTTLPFNVDLVGDSQAKTFTVTNVGGGTLSGTVTESCGEFSVTPGSYSLTNGQSQTFTVTYAPTDCGNDNCTINTGAPCNNVTCNATGPSSPVCSVDPTELNFVAGDLGLSDTQTFTITNPNCGTLSGSITWDCPDFDVVPTTYGLGRDETETFTVTYAPLDCGDDVCVLETGGLCGNVTCNASGPDIPECSVDPTELRFYVEGLGKSQAWTFTITNVRCGELIGTITENCDEFEVDPATYNLGPDESLDVTVTFTSIVPGTGNCTIDLGNDCGQVLCDWECIMVWHVATDGNNQTGDGFEGNPVNSIQRGIYIAQSGEIVELAPGVYYEDGIRLESGVRVRGAKNGKSDVIVDGQGRGSLFDCRNVNGATVEGLTITGGTRSAIYCSNSSVSIRDCRFEGNSTRTYGGGAITTRYSSPTVENCTFTHNHTDFYGGAIYAYESTLTLSGCTMSKNRAGYDGGGLYLKYSSAGVTDCSFEENTADDGGGIYALKSSMDLDGCIFWANSGGGGGGLFANRTPLEMTSCTFAGNAADYGSAMCLWTPARSTVENTIVVFNENGPWCRFLGSNSKPTFLCCDAYGNFGGDWAGPVADQGGVNGNMCEDPLFCDGKGGNCYLTPGSPCADALGCGQIGALGVESGAVAPKVALAPAATPEENRRFDLGPTIPNPFNPTTEITYSVPSGAGPSRITLIVYNALGRRIRTLVDAEKSAGVYAVAWDGTDDAGSRVAPGVYFCRLKTGEFEATRKLVLMAR